jgi:isocitrate dehydrogenase (NAD+)
MNGTAEAARAFEVLLKEQLLRQEELERTAEPADHSKKRTVTVGLIDGDGIGPVIMGSARTVLGKLLEDGSGDRKTVLRQIEGLTLRERLNAGRALPEGVLAQVRECDVILKGPTETPHGGTLESANVALRRELDLYANVRPVRVPEKNIDWVFFRENSEGEYVLGSRGIMVNDGMAVDFKITTRAGTRRIAEAAFGYAARNGRRSVTAVTKANIMKKTDGLFSEVVREVAAEYPGIELKERYVDIMSAELINEDARSCHEVILLPNLYGDILTDEAAQIQGGVGTAGSANLGTRYAMFEAIHGTAPRLVAEGLAEKASPVSILRAAVLMLRHILMPVPAARLETALDSFGPGEMPDGTLSSPDCASFTEALLRRL